MPKPPTRRYRGRGSVHVREDSLHIFIVFELVEEHFDVVHLLFGEVLRIVGDALELSPF